MTHTRQLLGQWRERIQSFLTGVEVGVIGAGKRKPTGQIDIATYQSLTDRRDNSVSPLVGQYGQIIIDECHHISAPRFEMVLNEIRARYVLGLTATPDRQDGHQKILFMLAGPVRHKVRTENKAKFQQTVIVNRLYEQPLHFTDPPHISDVCRWLMESTQRNQRITDDVAAGIKAGRHPLVLTERREHAERLAKMLTERGFQAIVLRGAMRAGERKTAHEQLPKAEVIVATGRHLITQKNKARFLALHRTAIPFKNISLYFSRSVYRRRLRSPPAGYAVSRAAHFLERIPGAVRGQDSPGVHRQNPRDRIRLCGLHPPDAGKDVPETEKGLSGDGLRDQRRGIIPERPVRGTAITDDRSPMTYPQNVREMMGPTWAFPFSARLRAAFFLQSSGPGGGSGSGFLLRLGSATLADAILDYLIHNTHRLSLHGESMRCLSQKTAPDFQNPDQEKEKEKLIIVTDQSKNQAPIAFS